ncbi:hypothetical protein Drorol1_Dr00011820 [Drosera rotundifolia]
MALKSIDRAAMVTLSPDSPYLAAGTAAGQVDESFSTSSFLEIFKLDFQSDDVELPVLGQCSSVQRFYRLSWGKGGYGDGCEDGIVAGGMGEGCIGVWNPRPLIRSEKGVEPLICQLSEHKGEVHGLEFNSLSPNLLASGADDGEIYIWNLESPKDPSHFPVLKGTGSAVQGQISYVSWNSKVQHILASTSFNGTTVVWDLRKQKPVISFSDSTSRRCSILQWNPDVATQVIVASDDDNSPTLRLWDMRKIAAPLREFVGHNKGVLSMSWCPIDSSFLLSSGKDNRTICWNTHSGEIVSEFPMSSNSTFDIHWYPKIPGVVSTSSYEGKIGLYNVEACSKYGVGEADIHAAPLRAPKWYIRPVGVSFGFGGKLVSFHSKTSAGPSEDCTEINIHSLEMEGSLLTRSFEFEVAVRDKEKASLRVLCERKSQEAESEDDRETWGLLKVMFEDGRGRETLLAHLGFSKREDAKDTPEDDLPQQVNGITLDSANEKSYEDHKDTTIYSYDNGEDFFNSLPSPKADTPVATSANNFGAAETVAAQDLAEEQLAGQVGNSDPASDDAVLHALVVEDYKTAVALCIAANKMADALVIAHAGGASLWESTRDQYLKTGNSPYLKVVSALVKNDLMSLVKTRPLQSWKRTLALICTFANEKEWAALCDTLASKLLVSGNKLAATLCYMCAGNIDKTLAVWSEALSAEPDGKPYVDTLQDLMEKALVFALATGQNHFSASFYKLVELYTEILASQGLLSIAMGYLKLLGEDLTPELVILRDRISLSTEPAKDLSPVDPGYLADQTFAPTEAAQPYYKGTAHQPPHEGPLGNSYVQETAQQPSHQGAHGSPYGDHYQPSFNSYGTNYPSHAPAYQPVQQPQMFTPSPSPQVPQLSFAPSPVNTQPAVRPFVPTPSSPLKNADKYQHPSTLATQLYAQPGNAPYQQSPPVPVAPANPSYQHGPPGPVGPATSPYTHGVPGPVGPVTTRPGFAPGQNPPYNQPVASARGFMPVTNPVATNRSTPSSPTHLGATQQAPVQPPVAVPAPPPTVKTVDTSNVPANLKPVIKTLTRLFNETSEAFGGAHAPPQKKREIEDNSRKLGSLFDKLNKKDISDNVADKLVQFCQALDHGNFETALHIQVQLTTSDWDECNTWLVALKRLIRARQSVR